MTDRPLMGYDEVATVLENLGLIIREARRARRLSLREMGAQVPCSYSALSRMESGAGNLNRDNLVAVLRWLAEPPR